MADTIFDAPEPTAFEEIVGEGKKFKSPEALAEAKLEADRTIAARNEELERHREEIRRQAAEIELLKRPREPLAQEPPKAADRPVVDEPNIDLASRIREELRQAQEEDIQAQNIRSVASRLTEVYGSPDKAREVVVAKAEELGLSVEFLQSVASKSPKAFFAQLGLAENTPQNQNSSRSDVNTAALANTSSSAPKQGSYASYEQMRKDQPKRYFSAEIQNQMFADAKRLGDAFFN
jgi:hypothetical protein